MIDDERRSLFYEMARYWPYHRNPTVLLSTGATLETARRSIEELRETNPDEHALLTELIVLPERKTDEARD